MGNALIAGAGQLQAFGLGILVIAIIVIGMRLVGQGPKGFASGLMEAAGVLLAAFLIMRPNDAMKLFSGMVGGIQIPVMPS